MCVMKSVGSIERAVELCQQFGAVKHKSGASEPTGGGRGKRNRAAARCGGVVGHCGWERRWRGVPCMTVAGLKQNTRLVLRECNCRPCAMLVDLYGIGGSKKRAGARARQPCGGRARHPARATPRG